MTDPTVLMAILTFLLICCMMIRRVKGAILLGMLVTTLLGIAFGMVKMPTEVMSFSPSLAPIFGKLDIAGVLRPEFFPMTFTMFVILFVDTMCTLIGLSYMAGFLDEKGNLPEVEKPMLCDSIATMAGSIMGTTASGAYIESAAGIEAGGRSGFASVVTALLFLIALLFFPLLTLVPAYAYGPALIVVGTQMLSPVRELDFDDMTEVIPTFVTIISICFSYNLGMGIAAGFITYPLIKLFAGRAREIPAGLWILAGMSLLFFILYPYGGSGQ